MATPTITHESFVCEYDVFLSFRGEDTRKTFTDHLYSALHQVGIRTFKDEEELRKGEYLALELTRAIQSSRVSIIVFSKDYASSRWCLDELVQIIECKEKGKHTVLPIFYDVEPSEVRKQSGNYGLAFAKHKERFQGSDKVQKWRDALTKVADMSGWDLQGIANGYESKFINLIIKEVQLVIRRVPLFVAKHGVGLDSRVEHVIQLLHGKSNDGVRMIGIYGMGGIGKTTLAKAVYNRLFGHFESSCFLEIDSAISGQQADNGINLEKVENQIKKVQKQMFQKLLNEEIDVGSIDEGIMLMKRRLQAKKCFIVLDNLEHRNQFNKLCGGRDWFGGGSRLILTTREAHFFTELEVDEHYKAKVLNHKESLQLFSLHAFREPTLPKEDYTKLLDDILAYCGGLPLALEVLGAYLSHKSRNVWISAIEKLKKIPDMNIQAKLKISYDGLPDGQIKSLFLDLVCFSHGVSKATLDSMGYFSETEIQDLADKCLINNNSDYISMHSLIREMGREIIRLEAPNNPCERSRLWCPDDIHDVLKGEKGTIKTEVIIFNDSPMKNMKYSTKAFKNMKNLRFLEIDGVHFYGKFGHLPNVLRYLQWNHCPLEYIKVPSNCSFEKLVTLKMWNSNIKEFQTPLKYFPCLESLHLDGSNYLTKTPDFSGAQNLRYLSFCWCQNLVKVHPSIGELVRLEYLFFNSCSKLKELPNNLCQLTKLELIGLKSCENLEVLPKFSHSVTGILLCNCKNLELFPQLPPSIESIDLSGCRKLKMLPELSQKLVSLEARNCVSLEKVSISSNCTELYWLDFSGCTKLKEIKGWENLRSLRVMKFGDIPHNNNASDNIKKVMKFQVRRKKGYQYFFNGHCVIRRSAYWDFLDSLCGWYSMLTKAYHVVKTEPS